MLVVCSGMIRSGSTLQYNLACQLVEAAHFGNASGWFDDRSLDDERAQLLSWAEAPSLYVIKAHSLPAWLLDYAGGGVRICYIYRDLRDVAASAKEKWGIRGEQLITAIRKALLVKSSVARCSYVLSQKYETCVQNIGAMAEEIAAFLRLPCDFNTLAQLAADNHISQVEADTCNHARRMDVRLRRMLLSMTGALRLGRHAQSIGMPDWLITAARRQLDPWNGRTLFHGDHISSRKGAVGAWHSVLDAEEIHEIEELFGDWLQSEGYCLQAVSMRNPSTTSQ